MEILKIILYLVFFVVGVMVWLFSGVIAWEFTEWLVRKKAKESERNEKRNRILPRNIGR